MKKTGKLSDVEIELIKENFSNLNGSFIRLKDFKKELYNESIFIKAQHGNFGGESKILSIGASITLSSICNFEKLKLPISYKKLNKIVAQLVIGYHCKEGTGYLILEYNQLKVNKEKQLIMFDYIASEKPGFPGHMKIENKGDFKRLLKSLRNCYSAAGFKQKGILINV